MNNKDGFSFPTYYIAHVIFIVGTAVLIRGYYAFKGLIIADTEVNLHVLFIVPICVTNLLSTKTIINDIAESNRIKKEVIIVCILHALLFVTTLVTGHFYVVYLEFRKLDVSTHVVIYWAVSNLLLSLEEYYIDEIWTKK